MKYVLATNTGSGFYTHEDREKIPYFRIYDDLIILTDNLDAIKWIKKVGGTEITEQEAITKLEDQFNMSKTKEITRLQNELSRKQSESFVFKSTKLIK